MNSDTKFYITNEAKKFKKSMTVYSLSKTIGIIVSLFGIGLLIFVVANFILGAFFGNLARRGGQDL